VTTATVVGVPAPLGGTIAGIAALGALCAAIVVITFGGVYGSRIAWLVGVALPLLATSAVLSWLAQRRLATQPGRRRGHRVVFVTAVTIFCIPFALAGALLVLYGVSFTLHE
jgi:membrane protein YqaA with SNARE-associated domain